MRVLGMLLALSLTAALSTQALADQMPSSPGAKVFIVSPKNGAKVKSPVTVLFGIKGMTVGPAGVKADNTGHYHLLIDTPVPSDLGTPLPATDNIKHFGKAQTQTTIDLAPGKHTLQLLFADYLHVPFNPNVVSKKITITVE